MNSKLNDLWDILTRSELWATIAVVLGSLQVANVIPEDSPGYKVLCAAVAVLAALGYGTMRTVRKIKNGK